MYLRSIVILFGMLLLAACVPPAAGVPPITSTVPSDALPDGAEPTVALPAPRLHGDVSVEEALARRRSVRDFTATPLSPAELGQLLWSAQGITSPEGFRTAPSAGARFPLEVYAVLSEGVYHYEPHGHQLRLHVRGDQRPALHAVALRQNSVLRAPTVIVITAIYERTASRYGMERTPRYVHLEAGHAAQNVLLQAVVMGLGAVPIGAFYDDQVQQALSLPADQQPLYLIPVGYPQP